MLYNNTAQTFKDLQRTSNSFTKEVEVKSI